MYSSFTENYINRLRDYGIHEDDAAIIVNDFLRDLDFEGLADYCAELEQIHKGLKNHVETV